MPLLARLAALELGLLVVHVVDHMRQGRETPPELTYVALLGFVSWGVVLALGLRRSRHAQLAAALVGFGTLLGFVVVHVVPRWSDALSDPYGAAGVDAISWITMALPALCGLAAGLAALPLRRRAVA